MSQHFDVIIVGAGLSGIGAACHLRQKCPDKTFAILEGRETTGGTWDLFRYPGIRSDSDMFTLGYEFKPWEEQKAIADGPSILAYLRETAREHDVERHIRVGHRVVRASWSSEEARWTLEVDRGSDRARFTCSFLWMCTGYYDYDAGYTPDFPGRERFHGRVVHPQRWTDDIEWAGKRVVVIGSGATAVTLVPELSKDAAHVVMLQRSPTYIVSRPSVDPIATWLRERLPRKAAYSVVRWKNVLLTMLFYELSRRQPERVKKLVREAIQKELGPGYDVDEHFSPSYDPWDQRVCLVPDSDLFAAIRSGKASVVTDRIETFSERGILLSSGRELEADLIVTATGLELRFGGKVELEVDGRAIPPGSMMTYKGMMFTGVPNLACTFGYTNASWTLKADLTADHVCRLLRHMSAIGARACTPRLNDPDVTERPFINLKSGYVDRGLPRFPKQGSKRPWRLYQNYLLDLLMLRLGSVDDASLHFEGASTSLGAGSAGAGGEGARRASANGWGRTLRGALSRTEA